MTWETGTNIIGVLAVIWLVIAIQRARGRLPITSDEEIRAALDARDDPTVIPGDLDGDGVPDSIQGDDR